MPMSSTGMCTLTSASDFSFPPSKPVTPIAVMLGITYESVKMNLSLARKRLKEELKEHI